MDESGKCAEKSRLLDELRAANDLLIYYQTKAASPNSHDPVRAKQKLEEATSHKARLMEAFNKHTAQHGC